MGAAGGGESGSAAAGTAQQGRRARGRQLQEGRGGSRSAAAPRLSSAPPRHAPRGRSSCRAGRAQRENILVLRPTSGSAPTPPSPPNLTHNHAPAHTAGASSQGRRLAAPRKGECCSRTATLAGAKESACRGLAAYICCAAGARCAAMTGTPLTALVEDEKPTRYLQLHQHVYTPPGADENQHICRTRDQPSRFCLLLLPAVLEQRADAPLPAV
jgi:hypothetical protein